MNPFTTNGVQYVIAVAPGWTSFCYIGGENTEDVRKRTQEWCEEIAAFTSNIELAFYGYDPRVLADNGEIIGTDGYPDAVGTWNDETEEITWERA
jgi:hypothetical protein